VTRPSAEGTRRGRRREEQGAPAGVGNGARPQREEQGSAASGKNGARPLLWRTGHDRRLEHLHSEPDEAPPGTLIFHPDGEKRLSRAPGSSISPGSGHLSIRRAQAIPGLPGHARGLRTKQTGAKLTRKFARVPAGRVAPTYRREWAVVVIVSSSPHASSSARCKGCRRWPASHAARRVNASAAI
jgi:hypothetical protein